MVGGRSHRWRRCLFPAGLDLSTTERGRSWRVPPWQPTAPGSSVDGLLRAWPVLGFESGSLLVEVNDSVFAALEIFGVDHSDSDGAEWVELLCQISRSDSSMIGSNAVPALTFTSTLALSGAVRLFW